MGFPGRLNEKKKPTIVFWSVIALIAAVVGWMVWSVAKVIREPLPPVPLQQQLPVQSMEEPGFLQKKADHALDNLEQIRKKEFLRPPSKREYSQRGNGAAVIYEPEGDEPRAEGQKAGYYSSEGESRR